MTKGFSWVRENRPGDAPVFHLNFRVGNVHVAVSTAKIWGFHWNRRSYIFRDHKQFYYRSFAGGFFVLHQKLGSVAEGERGPW